MILSGWFHGIAGLVLSAALFACGHATRHFVGARDQRALPTKQFSAGEELCPERTLRVDRRAALKRKGVRHADALIGALRRVPHRYVHTTFASSDEGPGEEDLTVVALAMQWSRSAYCAPHQRGRVDVAIRAVR